MGAAAVALLVASTVFAQSDADRTFVNAGITAFRAGRFTEAAKDFRGARFASVDHPEKYEEVLALLAGRPVLCRQRTILACTFHPELSGDARLHRLFLEM